MIRVRMPRGKRPTLPEDLRPARGVATGVLISGVLWLAIVGLMVALLFGD